MEGTGPDFIDAAFALEPGQARALPVEDGAVVLRLDAVEPAPQDEPAVTEEREAIAAQISGSIAQDLFDAYARQLQMNTEVRLDDRAVAAVNAQMN